MVFAKKSTARVVTVGPVLDADGVAVTNGVVGDFKASKNGGVPGALDGSATLTHRHTGFYSLSLTANDYDTVGTLEITIDDTVNACPMKEIQVLETAIYDALFADTANAFSGAAGSTTLTALAAGSVTAAVIANGAIDAATFAADVDAEVLSYIVDDATRIDASALNTASVTTVPAIDAKTTNLPSDPADASVVAGQISAVETKVDTVDTVVDAIKAKTDSLTFTQAGQVDANVQRINDVTITGDGQAGTEFGV